VIHCGVSIITLLLLLTPLASASKLDLNTKPEVRLKTPEDAFRYWFPFIEKFQVIKLNNYVLKLDTKRIKFSHRGRTIPSSKIVVALAYSNNLISVESPTGYFNSLDVDRWVFYIPFNYDVYVNPLTKASSASHFLIKVIVKFNYTK